jgi:hypothetical protein
VPTSSAGSRPAPPDAPLDPLLWIEARMAARALGKGPSWLKRTVPQDLAPRDLAVFSAPPGGGVARWFVRRSIDLALAPGVGHQYLVPTDEIERYPRRSQRLMYARVAAVNALREARAAATHPQYQWIADLCRSLAEQNALEVSPRTLTRGLATGASSWSRAAAALVGCHNDDVVRRSDDDCKTTRL